MEEAVLGAFSVFFTQSPSFLSHQRTMQEKKGLSNAQTLFSMTKILSCNWIRKLLDPVPPQQVFPVCSIVFEGLKETGRLEQFKDINGNLLIALDGLQYHSSHTIHCDNCSEKHHKNGEVTYSHSAITPVILSPNSHTVISLSPEFITPQDGHKKQDCEIAAAKRWIAQHAHSLKDLGVTILGDDLYSRQPSK